MPDERRSPKDELPHPYNQNFSAVIRHLDRRTPFAKERLANDPATAAYIRAGIELLRRHLGPNAERTRSDPADEDSLNRPVLAFLSQRAVADEVANNPSPFLRQGTVSALRDRWKWMSHYIADLLSFGLWSMHEPAQYDDRIAPDTEELVNGSDFVGAAHRLCYVDLTEFMNAPTFRLSLIATAAAEGDEVIQEALAENHRGALQPWKEVYQAMLDERGLKLRPGIDVDELANMMAALEVGFVMRGMGIPESVKIDRENQRSSFGTAALALLLGVVERDYDGRNLTVEEAVRNLIYGRADSEPDPDQPSSPPPG